jgi:hypothetical protein
MKPLNDGEMNVRCPRTRLVDGDHQVEQLKNSIKSLLRMLSWFDFALNVSAITVSHPKGSGVNSARRGWSDLQSLRLTFVRARAAQVDSC